MNKIDCMPDRLNSLSLYVRHLHLPLWASAGWNDVLGCNVEQLDEDLQPSPLDYRRSMVAGRQLFLFSRAYRLYGDALYAERAHRIYQDLVTRFWDKHQGGWYFSVGIDGTAKDTRKDLYAHSFAMFGLAQYFGIFGDAEALRLAAQTNDLIERRLLLPGGWFASVAAADWTIRDSALEQNPHMHLLEAYLSLYGATKDKRYLVGAERIVDMVGEILHDRESGAIREHFDECARPHPQNGHVVWPGHQFEWYWLLNEFADAVGSPACTPIAERALDWAVRYGIDREYGGIFNRVGISGELIDERKRIWPVGEAIKAYVTRFRHGSSEADLAAVQHWVGFLNDAYIRPNGAWFEYLNRDLSPSSRTLPASTGYHLATPLLELQRLAGGAGVFAF